PNGNQVTQQHDAAGRLSVRTITRGLGVEGPSAESYAWDGLNRLVSATSGSVVSARSYDSMSRLLSETTAGRTITYTPDDVGNVEGIAYPSGRSIESAFDKIDRPSRIGPQDAPVASFGFRGPDLVASRGYGNGLSGTSSFDGARRPTATTVTTSDGTKAFAESIAWTPRSLKS